MSVAKEVGIPVPKFYLSDNAKLFVMRRFDRDGQLNPIGFEDMAALMGLSAQQKYSKSYGAIATTAYIPEDVLALDLGGNKSLFASRQGLMDFAVTCDVARPKEIICEQLQALEQVLARSAELCEQAPDVVRAIRQSAGPFISTFG